MISFVVGIILILAGVFVPSSALVAALRTAPVSAGLMEQLLLGATLFKVSLVVLALLILTLKRTSIWTPEVQTVQTEKPLFGAHRKSDLVILATILLVATVLRLHRLDDGLWFDEIVTYVKYVQVPFGEIISTYDNQNQHLLYSLLAHLAFQIFGESAWSLRLPAVLFGTGSIWALYLLGREVSNSREALLSAALLAFSYHHVWFSQNARGYTALLFWTILASWLFLRALREATPRLWVLYAVAVALGAYALIYMLFVVIGHFIIYLIALYARRKKAAWTHRWAGLFLGFCLAGFLTFQLHALVLPQFFDAFAQAEVVGSIWTHPLWGFLEFVKGMQMNFSGSIVAIIALLVFGAGLLSYARTNPAVVGLLIIPALVCIVVKVAMGHHLWPRSLIFIMGFGALVVVRGAMVLGHLAAHLFQRLNLAVTKSIPVGGEAGAVGTALCVGLILVSALSVPFAYGPKQDYLGALTFVEDKKEPGDAIVTVGLAAFPYKNLYKVDWEEIETLDALNGVRSRAQRTWLVYTIPIQLQDVYPEIGASIQRDFKVVKQFYGTLNGGTIFVCQLDASPSYASDLR